MTAGDVLAIALSGVEGIIRLEAVHVRLRPVAEVAVRASGANVELAE